MAAPAPEQAAGAAVPKDIPLKDDAQNDAEVAEQDVDAAHEGKALINLTIHLPHEPKTLTILEQVHEVRQSIIDLPAAFRYTCFHLEYQGKRVNDFVPVSEALSGEDHELKLVEDPYTEKEARIHFVRIRELIGAAGDRTDVVQGILSGLSLLDTVGPQPAATLENGQAQAQAQAQGAAAELEEYAFAKPASISQLLPPTPEDPPRTLKALSLSTWNPPPCHLRQKGHLLYLVASTLEGEQHQITAHVGGFYVNKSSNNKFDPWPKPSPKALPTHSLLDLFESMSAQFGPAFIALQEFNNQKDPLATIQISNAIPAAPWIIPPPTSNHCVHVADAARSQETYLIAGADNTDTLRDWNEEFQSAKELPKETVQDRVFRERLVSKLFADYNDAATRGAIMVARGEIPPLNPTECEDAQIFVYNNIFFSFGADGVGTFTSEGGDEAARVATGKDVAGVRLVNQLDIDGLFTTATVVVDYLGKRVVGQSIVPGIFKPREPGENQIDYGAVEGKEIVAADERFVSVFEKLSQALKVKKHPVWDKDGKRVDLETSVETKGLMGTDGRKYVLDLYRVTPLDVTWLEVAEEQENAYPHRMAVLRPELVDAYSRKKMKEWVDAEMALRGHAPKGASAADKEKEKEKDNKKAKEDDSSDSEEESSEEEEDDEEEESSSEEESSEEEDSDSETEKPVKPKPAKTAKPSKAKASKAAAEEKKKKEEEHIDLSKFTFSLNPDAFSGQTPQTAEEKAALEADEEEVRAIGLYLTEQIIPELVRELKECDISFPMDGQALSRTLHKRGINVRYTGRIASLSTDPRLECLYDICLQDMVARAFKHAASSYLRKVPPPLASSCMAHLLNCLLGYEVNPEPVADVDATMKALYSESETSFEAVTPETLRSRIVEEIQKRFRFELTGEWEKRLKPLQLLREISLKLGLQLQLKNYPFTKEAAAEIAEVQTQTNGAQTNGNGNNNGNGNGNTEGKKKKKNKGQAQAQAQAQESSPAAAPVKKPLCTFTPDDIVNMVPVVKHSSPRSALSEEALEAGRISIMQGQRKLGQELLLESLSLHEQIYGILHPEVARVYNTLSMLYYQLDEKEAAVELARKAIVVAERTVGVDSAETLLNYLNLSLFLHQTGDSKSALTFAKHALDLWKIIYGPDHPDSITTINNGAVMLQHLKAYHESRLWFEESLRVCEKVFGKTSVNAATLQFQLAQALALDQDSKGAVNRMRESYNIFHSELGADDKNTKEAENWLEQLTQNAVSIAKHAKDLHNRRLRPAVRFTQREGGPLDAAPTAQAPASAGGPQSQLSGAPQIDSRSIDDLIRFIEGNDQQTSKTAKGSGRGNPKRRGKGRA